MKQWFMLQLHVQHESYSFYVLIIFYYEYILQSSTDKSTSIVYLKLADWYIASTI